MTYSQYTQQCINNMELCKTIKDNAFQFYKDFPTQANRANFLEKSKRYDDATAQVIKSIG